MDAAAFSHKHVKTNSGKQQECYVLSTPKYTLDWIWTQSLPDTLKIHAVVTATQPTATANKWGQARGEYINNSKATSKRQQDTYITYIKNMFYFNLFYSAERLI